MKKISSYISASQYPAKLIRHYIEQGSAGPPLTPIHTTINITNTCNLKCPYCATKDRMKDNPHMPFELFRDLMKDLVDRYRLRAISFSGGGDATCHPEFERFVGCADYFGLATALITNGINLVRIDPEILKKLHWVRISMDGYRSKIPTIPDCIFPGISWVFNVGDSFNPLLLKLVDMAGDRKIKHLRIHQDIYNADTIDLPKVFAGKPGVILHERTDFTPGTPACWNGHIWPRIDVDGRFWPCCGIQYALKGHEQGKAYPETLCMGDYEAYKKTIEMQIPVDGVKCFRCFYEPRNTFLGALKILDSLENPEFA